MTFTPDQWLILLLTFVLGLVLGAAILASPKWKARYREEVTRREEAEAENERLKHEFDTERDRTRRDAAEMDSLRHAAAKDEARHDDRDRPGPL